MNKNQLTFVNCDNCGRDDYQVLFNSTIQDQNGSFAQSVRQYTGTTNEYGKYFRLVKCRHCGLIFENPRDNDELVLKNYHEVVDPAYLETQEERQQLFSSFLNEIEMFTSSGTLLDIGCYAGLFLMAARSKGWKVSGVEPSRWAKEHAQSQGLNISASTVEEAKFPDQSFDVVTMWDVIEHVNSPKSTLNEINRITRPSGLLALSTHNPESLLAKVLGGRYPFFMRMHLYHFSPRLLKEMLAKAGFQVLTIKTNGRKFRLSYLLERLNDGNPLKKPLQKVAAALNLSDIKIRINFRDTYRLYARKIRDAEPLAPTKPTRP